MAAEEGRSSGGAFRRLLRSAPLLPALLFLAVTFYGPLAGFVFRSVDNEEVPAALPRTTAILGKWDRHDLPDKAAFAALVADLREAREKELLPDLARRLNYAMPGFRSILLRTARRLNDASAGDPRASLVAIDPAWGERAAWAAIADNRGRFTDFYFLAALDLERNTEGEIARVSEDRAVYTPLFIRTLVISLSVTALCLVIGYPVAFVIASSSARLGGFLMMFVLLPFWTSLLVRTTAWIVLLQNEGLLNQALLALGIISEPLRILGTRSAVLIAMTHVLLPYMVLPLFSVMKGIKEEYGRAAANLGATPWAAFWRVYFPQTLPGATAGALLVFILALGYYVTPALVGGPSDQMVSYFVALYTNESLNWGMAAALGAILLVLAGIVYAGFNRAGGLDRVR